MTDDPSFFQQHMGGVIAGAAVLAYFAQPILPLVDPNWLMLDAVLISGGVGFTWKKPSNLADYIFGVVGFALLIGGMGLGAYLLIPAANEATTNNRRCLVYEIDMVAAKPRWSNSRDLFQALGCRARSDDLAKAQGHPGYVDVGGMPAPALVPAEHRHPGSSKQ